MTTSEYSSTSALEGTNAYASVLGWPIHADSPGLSQF